MRSGAVVVAAGLLLALAGCVPTVHDPASPSPSATPVFSSDAAALKAAEAAYAAYLKVSDQIANDGGKDPERFSTVVTSRWLPTELSSASKLEESGRHQTGVTASSSLTLEQVGQDDQGAELVAYTCLDLTGTRILNAVDEDVTPGSRQAKVSLEVTFRSKAGSASQLLVDSNEPWSGPTFC
ncbi:MAG TPA: hypothetical protein VGM70_06930 [Pseudolysinimonas sp.]|jgi:hypothetical protein